MLKAFHIELLKNEFLHVMVSLHTQYMHIYNLFLSGFRRLKISQTTH
jgi:hypothetical protein